MISHKLLGRLSNQRALTGNVGGLPLANDYVSLGRPMVGCRAGEVLTVVHRATNSSVRRRGHQWWSTRLFRERSERDHYWGLHGELKVNMRQTSLMMYISPALLFILYVYIGFSEAAPRISPYDASPISRKPGSASDTWETFFTNMPRSVPESSLALGPLAGLNPQPAIVSAGPTTTTTSNSGPDHPPPPPTTTPSTAAPDTGIIIATKEQLTAPISRLNGASKRSTDAQASLFSPEKRLQTMVSMVSQRTANDAWAADNIGTSVTSIENSQESVCNCSSGAEGVRDPDDCDHNTGQCSCLSGYTGLQCEDCEEGHYTNGTSGCMPCACDSSGAVNSLCDSSGICVCKTGVYGPKCDECHPGFFYFSSTGCRPCHPGADPPQACAPCPCSNSTSTGTCQPDGSSPQCVSSASPYSGPLCDQCSAASSKLLGCVFHWQCRPSGPPPLSPRHRPMPALHQPHRRGPCQLCAEGFIGDAGAHNCTRPAPRLLHTPPHQATTEAPTSSPSSPSTTTTSITLTSAQSKGVPASTSGSNSSTALSTASTQALLTSLSPPPTTHRRRPDRRFNIIILAVIILVVLVLLGFVGGVYTYREYQNRKLNAPFWTIELKEDNISFSSYHDSIPNADVSGLLEDEANEVVPNGQLALTTQGNCYKA
ncbi:hypothetical protein F7725_013438 [Dissostichus mawsoni]|uniref:Laminin EGF-like domain-containing protein n=1 Tax=Dissostichus mawsoni TaxID=36200 RepID=A0A7J5YQ79_DISMA|nr:hypothetical protein F7725_013438 [Dissostichus mawsoni]